MFTVDDCCAAALTAQSSLLSLGALCITDKDLPEICEAIKGNPKIQELQLYTNDISNTGAYTIAALILSSPNIIKIDLSDNKIGIDGQDAIMQAVRKTGRAIEVDFSNNVEPTRTNYTLNVI